MAAVGAILASTRVLRLGFAFGPSRRTSIPPVLRPLLTSPRRAGASRPKRSLAHEADITTGTLSLIERGHANPTWGTLKGITAALGVSMGELGKLADKLDQA